MVLDGGLGVRSWSSVVESFKLWSLVVYGAGQSREGPLKVGPSIFISGFFRVSY